MALNRQPVQWRRIHRQTVTLIHKNFLIFYASPISTFVRALLIPLTATIVLCYLKYLNTGSVPDKSHGIASSSFPVKDLASSMGAVSRHKLAFVRNGISNQTISPIVDGILQLPGMQSMDVRSVDDPNDLFDICKQSVQGQSDCYAAVIFTSFNETNVDYSIVLDSSLDSSSWGDWPTGNTTLAKHIFPLQWAVESQIGGFPVISKPFLRPWAGTFGPHYIDYSLNSNGIQTGVGSTLWVYLIATFVAPIFFLIIIGVVYHLATFVATERETSMSELMAAQKVSIIPRMLSTFISFFALYFPGLLFCSIIMTQVLFTKTSDILMIFLTLLAGASLITSSHFVASFFGKAQLAGLYASVLAFALSLVTLAATLSSPIPTTQVLAIALIFPPATWATLIEDIAVREVFGQAFSLVILHKTQAGANGKSVGTQTQFLDGYLYIVFFIVHIVVFSGLTYLVERQMWGVTRNFDRIEADSDVALRCTGLTKTYYAKRSWYWPFTKKGKTLVAVDSLDLEVKKGSVTFLLGPNGGGKTTALKCVAGMTSMDTGSQLELNEAGLVFGICPQHNVFWNGLSVQQHITIWRKLKTAAFEDNSVDDDDVLAECDLLEKAKAIVSTLSGGQMRKLQLAISFVGGSKVCCIDEASSGLDPLSRRNIWNIIQKGHARRTILVTTHFLDEADVLADHIAIVYKGKMVCEGPSTSLKARFGDNYLIRGNNDIDNDNMVWRTSNSAEATRKLLELEALDNDHTYNVVFPTLEQVFLKVTSDTAIHARGGDGFVGEQEATTVIDEKIFALEQETLRDFDLDVGHAIGLARQVRSLFMKRYYLLQQASSWISYGINLVIPIIVAAALVKFLYKSGSLQTCSMNEEFLRNASLSDTSNAGPNFAPLLPAYSSRGYNSPGIPTSIFGPLAEWSGATQDEIFLQSVSSTIVDQSYYGTFTSSGSLIPAPPTNNTSKNENALKSREFVSNIDGMITQISNYSGQGFSGFGIYAPTPETATLFHSSNGQGDSAGKYLSSFNLITNRIANSSTTSGTAREVATSLRYFRYATNKVDYKSMPISTLMTLAFICASSIAIIYPTFEKNNRVRALHYCNGVSPFALWLGYLLFDTQIIIIQSIVVWGMLYAGPLARLYYASSYILGVFILFGMATYLGTYVLSLFVRKAAFAVAAGVHIVLFVLYLIGYVVNQAAGNASDIHQTYTYLQVLLGLSSPAANLARALWLATNSFEILCGKYGDSDSNPFSYDRYGSVYTNLIIQILFLIAVLAIYEYGSADWIRRNITHRAMPARLHYIVESGAAPAQYTESEKNARAATTAGSSEPILNVSRISKFFGKTFAVENVSFDISSNETLALLGGNGAGKTTVINMIRGELIPNFGEIFLDGTSVLRNPHQARLHMGVCPQDDAIDNLTVRQTLNFYATVKGLKDVAGNVDKVLNALSISIYQSVVLKALSGGTRRKLTVAIALLGNPRILLLDEPSTGQDAGAKRILWKTLQDISANRAILLTTHSMEEAEALATNVAIMGTKMLATGTLTSLQETYGGDYSIRAVRVEGTDADDVEVLVKEKFEGAVRNYEDIHGQISFNLAHDKSALGSIMRVMEGLKGDVIEQQEEAEGSGSGAAGSSSAPLQTDIRVLTDYTITGPTLEEVFMNVARETGITGGV